MKKDIYLVGAGGLGREVLSLIRALGDSWHPAGFYDDSVPRGAIVDGVPVVGPISDLMTSSSRAVVIAVGDPRARLGISTRLSENRALVFPSLIHPSVISQDPARNHIGAGAILCAGVILTTGIKVEDHVLINLACTIGHDVRIGRASSLMPGVNVAGETSIGEGTLIGSGAILLNRLHIGHQVMVGAGAVVTRDVPDNITVVGVPAHEKSSQ